MPVLLLAQGDATAKDLLRNAIEARYGLRPPAIDRLKIDFNGKARVKVGPVQTWVPLEVTAYFDFPTAMRWDFVAKPMGLPVQRGVEAYDGEVFRMLRGSKNPTVIDDEAQTHTLRRRLWAVASILLTPLSDMFVKLQTTGEHSLEAINTKLDDSAEIFLRDNHTIASVKVHCLNPDAGEKQDYTITVSEEQTQLDNLLLPTRLEMAWNGQPNSKLEPQAVESNPTFDDAVFRIEDT
jgi:hypothetical protein